jgi:hypothetical protein
VATRVREMLELFAARAVPAIAIVWLLLVVLDRDAARWLVREDRLVEWLEVVLLALALPACAVIARITRVAGVRRVSLVAMALIVIAILEELSWGQRIFGFGTPDTLRNLNVQGQLTLHNPPLLNRVRHWALIFFGMVGIVLVRRARRWPLLVPCACATAFWIALVSGAVREAGLLIASATSGIFAARVDFWSGRFTEIGELAAAAAVAATAWAALERLE